MVCYFHPDRESTNTCEICGKEICPECGLELAGKVYCKNCIENIVGLNINENNAPKAEEQVLEEPSIEETNIQTEETPDSETFSTPVFKDSASIEGTENPYKIIDDEESYKITPEKVPEVKEFSSEPNIFRESQPQVEEPILEEKAFTPIEEPDLTSIYEQEKERTLNTFSKPIVNEPEETILTTEKTFSEDKSKEYDVIYPDHTYEPPETSARRALEEKYEHYLDDLYFDEEVPLSEQLAQDEKEYGSLTESPYVPIEKENIPLNELYPEEFEETPIYEEPIKQPVEVEETPINSLKNEEKAYLNDFEVEEPQIYEEPKLEPVRTSVMGAGATGGIYTTEEIIEPQTETIIPAASGVYSTDEIRSTRDEPIIPAASGVYTETADYIEDDQVPMTFENEEDLENEIRRRLASKNEKKRIKKEESSPISFLKKEKPEKTKERRSRTIKDKKMAREIEKEESNKDPVGVVDVLLSILLIVVIVVVVFYLIYIFTLQAYYPTFTDALFGLADPKTFFNNIMNR